MSVMLSPREYEFSPEESPSFGDRATPVVPVPQFRPSQHALLRQSEPTVVVPNPALLADALAAVESDPPEESGLRASASPVSSARPAAPASIPPAVEHEFWNAEPQFPDSLPPPALISHAPRHAPSLLRRVLTTITFAVCLIGVLGLLGFEVGLKFKHTKAVQLARTLISMEFGN